MSDLTTHTYAVTIGGKEYPYALNMGVLDDVIGEHGYSGEDVLDAAGKVLRTEGDFMNAFADAETGNTKAMRLVVWAGIVSAFMDDDGVIDYGAAPPLTITNRAGFGELMEATAVASQAFIEALPRATLETIQAAAKEAEKKAKAEAAGRPTKARATKD